MEEVDYDDLELKLDSRREDKLENKIYHRAFSDADDKNLMAISQNKSVDQITESTTLVQLVKDEYKEDDFNDAIVSFAKKISKPISSISNTENADEKG